MSVVLQQEVPLFQEGRGSGPPEGVFLAGRGCQPDNNRNFPGGSYDSNENCCPSSGLLCGGDDAATTVPTNQVLLLHQKVRMGLRSEEEEEEAVRRPPEGAEVSSAEQEESPIKERMKESGKLVASPSEDNGYASSSLSIDSPDSGGANLWEAPTVAAEDWRGRTASPSPGAEPEKPSPSSEALFPALAEAFRNLQDKKKFKEREKEKHHIQLVMYRRLALLRWIRSLQQKVVDQQNRLQESFDTILDNRKELIRCVQQGMGCPKNPTQVEL